MNTEIKTLKDLKIFLNSQPDSFLEKAKAVVWPEEAAGITIHEAVVLDEDYFYNDYGSIDPVSSWEPDVEGDVLEEEILPKGSIMLYTLDPANNSEEEEIKSEHQAITSLLKFIAKNAFETLIYKEDEHSQIQIVGVDFAAQTVRLRDFCDYDMEEIAGYRFNDFNKQRTYEKHLNRCAQFKLMNKGKQ